MLNPRSIFYGMAIIAGCFQTLPTASMPVPQTFQLVSQNPWGVCDSYFAFYEKQYGVPAGLLRSVALVESGRYYAKKGEKVPWPWTINIEGEGSTYDTKAEAIAAVQQAQKQGKRSIDVGCMQINLKWHPDVFSNLEQAFAPHHNIAYAAEFLKGLKNDKGSWEEAVAHYHSATKELSNGYKKKVMSHWYKELSKNSILGGLPTPTLLPIDGQVSAIPTLKEPKKPLFSYIVPYPNSPAGQDPKKAKDSMWQNIPQQESSVTAPNGAQPKFFALRGSVHTEDNEEKGESNKDKTPHPLQSVILSNTGNKMPHAAPEPVFLPLKR